MAHRVSSIHKQYTWNKSWETPQSASEFMSKYSSALLLLQRTEAIQSYKPLLEKAAEILSEEASLDILILSQINKLNHLDQALAEVYNLASDVVGDALPHVETTVLYNGHYKRIDNPQWQAVVYATDEELSKFEHVEEELLDLIQVETANTSHKKIKLDVDASSEDISRVSAVGGTFDHFHNGHKILLTASAFITKEKLIVGITDQELLEKKDFKELLQSYDYRVHTVLKFLNRVKPGLEIDPQPIRDICGPTGYIEDIDSLIVSRETVSGGEFVNRTRKEKGMRQLEVHVINVIGGEAEDGFKNKLSSTQLRKEQFEKMHGKPE